VSKTGGVPPHPFIFQLGASAPAKESKSGDVRIADSTNFIVSSKIAAALVTVRPGGVREMHWHPNADEWQYYIKGKGRMTVFNTGPNANRKIGDGAHRRGIVNVAEFERRYGVRQPAMSLD
jgi:oxalate decarboxylase